MIENSEVLKFNYYEKPKLEQHSHAVHRPQHNAAEL